MKKNWIEYNIKNFKEKKHSISRIWLPYLHYKCNKCGADLSPAIPRYYQKLYKDKFVEHLLCYDCQKTKYLFSRKEMKNENI